MWLGEGGTCSCLFSWVWRGGLLWITELNQSQGFPQSPKHKVVKIRAGPHSDSPQASPGAASPVQKHPALQQRGHNAAVSAGVSPLKRGRWQVAVTAPDSSALQASDPFGCSLSRHPLSSSTFMACISRLSAPFGRDYGVLPWLALTHCCNNNKYTKHPPTLAMFGDRLLA